jgi:hypothetical protein
MCPLIWERELAGVQVSRLQSQVFLLGVGVVRARAVEMSLLPRFMTVLF